MRYLPLTDQDRQDMLVAIGAPDMAALYKDVATEVLLDQPVDLPGVKGELEVEQIISSLAAKNLGSGA
ncbi:MAG TPA: glycine dehydrogenase, partial [Rhodospirillales bacterium]|nr:glycine dehydrogenase [Rhodospirillales bacterium]